MQKTIEQGSLALIKVEASMHDDVCAYYTYAFWSSRCVASSKQAEWETIFNRNVSLRCCCFCCLKFFSCFLIFLSSSLFFSSCVYFYRPLKKWPMCVRLEEKPPLDSPYKSKIKCVAKISASQLALFIIFFAHFHRIFWGYFLGRLSSGRCGK